MATSWTDLANDALTKVGSQNIVSLEQATTGARLCKIRLPQTVNYILRRYPWKSAMDTVALTPLASPPPDLAWAFAYPLPTNRLRIWKYVPGTPLAGINYGSNYVIRQRQLWSNDGVNVEGNGTAPYLTYVFLPESPANLDSLCYEAMSCKLAVDICYQLTESLPLKQDLAMEYKKALQEAKTADAMESPEVFDFQASEFLTARFAGTGYSGPNYPGFPVAP